MSPGRTTPSKRSMKPERFDEIKVQREHMPKAFDAECAALVARRGKFLDMPLRIAGWKLRQAGMDGLGILDNPSRNWRAVDSVCREEDGEIWLHLSMSRFDGHMPSWAQQRDTWWDFSQGIKGIVVVAPREDHISGAALTTVEVAHVWGCLTKPMPIPDFSRGTGTI